ncbi:quinone oxidoreductase family protein [Streptomyces liangshanensis]|uniref:Zinc-binding dehydrogenase n=1 Tax=Streptomyces liangshanensis TaxID=2717324 RepID=A0A6G9H7Q4_9ACTN|nr:zinc-binding dehydrogenase [Streptomyces liangshanensis]QIQ06520.1 zinc-binding dehydrogenase [Streptomyces liangshanensis]
MRGVVVREFGGPERLEPTELPEPTPGQGEIVLAVEAAGVNRADVLARAGKYHRAGSPPLRLGLEGAGTVVAVADDVTDVAVGQRVLAFGATNEPGFYAERVSIAASQTVPVPDEVDSLSAAALPTAWLSAWYTLKTLARLEAGETVLVHAGASGVGSAAVQIAVDAGATVIATAGSPEKREWVESLGAHHVLDSRGPTSAERVRQVLDLTGSKGADVVLDTVGGAIFSESLLVAGNAGRVIAMANVALEPSTIDTRDFYPKNIRIFGFQITALKEDGYDPRPDLRELLAGLAEGRFSVPIDATYDLAEAGKAHAHLEDRSIRGKVLLTAGEQ